MERITSLPEDRLVRVAYTEMINDNRKDLWPNKNMKRKFFNSFGMSVIWNKGVGIGGEVGSTAKEVKIVLQE